ncbi:hypothetical protein SteCoe_9688 [Stentor coeruleus]|uniref:Eukaryotic translation initiation factor 2A n=1 Tax=Stentor coeruleus TaxID=5963 RepID=A0A1R2CH69_9CILI|nr:hypothetical protein SteCoe_9688 [Stentor coeruleus]
MEKTQQVHELLCRTRDSVRVIRGLSQQENVVFASACFACLFSKCGSKLAIVDLHGVKVLKTSDFTELMSVRRSNVQLLHFSECAKYLVSWEKPQEETPNLIIWDTTTGTPIYSLVQKKFMKECWPTIIFNADSTRFYIKGGSDLCIYRIPEPQPLLIFNQIRVTSFFISSKTNMLIIYTGDSKGEGSKISICVETATGLEKTAELGVKYVQEIKVLWNKDAQRAVIWCQTDVDTTGRSYYGEHSLYIYTPEIKLKQVKTTEGPIHDVQWNPVDNEFIVISGFMPATTNFFNLNGNKKSEIAKHHRNTIKWNRFGTLVLIAGFGNLHGEIDIYDKETMNMIGHCRAPSTVYCEWGPCGKVFVAATLCPRMRVDNGYCVYKYTGELLVRVMEPTELWEVAWTPQVFVFEPLTPSHKEQVVVQKKTYKPPGSSSGFAAHFKAVKESASGKLQVQHAPPPPPSDFIPGMAPEPAKKKKKKKKPAAGK